MSSQAAGTKANSGKSEEVKNGMNVYLVLYNVGCAIGWSVVLFYCIKNIALGSIHKIWKESEVYLKVVQTIAVMEVLHAFLGVVRSKPLTTFLQVFSRVWTLWAVMNVAPTAQTNVFTALACTSWSLVEVPRYLFYATKELSMTPNWLQWLRYSLFAVLYPTGISGELGCMYYAYLELMVSKDTSLVFLSHTIAAVVLTYIPGSPTMFMHMVQERRKVLGGAKKSTEKQK